MKLRYESVNSQAYWGVIQGRHFRIHREEGPAFQESGWWYNWYLGHTFICRTRIP